MRLRATLAAVAALFCLGAAPDPADELKNPAQEARARAMFQQIRCVVCQNESIDDSEAEMARIVRQSIRSQIAAGRSDAQVRGFLVQRYGEFILLRPPFSPANAAAWLTPFLIVGVGGLVILWRARRPPPAAGDPLTAEEEAKLAALRDS